MCSRWRQASVAHHHFNFFSGVGNDDEPRGLLSFLSFFLRCKRRWWIRQAHYHLLHLSKNRHLLRLSKKTRMKKKQIKNRLMYTYLPHIVATPLWGKCEDDTRTPKSGNLESSRTPETSELDFKDQNTLPWGVLYTIGKVLKCRCPKWTHMIHSDICNTSYGRKKVQEIVWLPTTKSRKST